MTTPKATLEYTVRIRMASGDSSSISTTDGNRFAIGHVSIDLDELDAFIDNLRVGITEAKRIQKERGK